MNTHTALNTTLLSVMLCIPIASHAADDEVFATDLTGPVKLALTEGGSLLVTERGTAENDGELSLVDGDGNVRALLSGLPSATEVTEVPSGPTAVVARGCCAVDLAISEGDTLRVRPDGPPGSQMPNPIGPSSPIFSSVLRVTFDQPVDEVTADFELTREDHETLADGFTVRLENDSGESASVRLVEDLKDFRPDPATNVRGSNPFGMTRGDQPRTLLIADGGQNSLVQVTPAGPPKTLVRFEQVPNPEGVVPPVTDAVPTSVSRLSRDRYLVTLFAGVPFAPGSASVRVVDIAARRESTLISGLTSVTDVLPIGSALYVLELSENLEQQAPGRLLRFATPESDPQVIASGLLGATGMVYSPREHAIYIAELFGDRITRVEL